MNPPSRTTDVVVERKQIALPDRKYFKIGEVAELVGVEPHVLRYWETQFPQVRPVKARSGHRLYRRRDVETLLVVRELLHTHRYTIAGARQAIRQVGAQSLLPTMADVATVEAAPRTRARSRNSLLPQPAVSDTLPPTAAVSDEELIDDELLDITGEGPAIGNSLEGPGDEYEDDEIELHLAGPRQDDAGQTRVDVVGLAGDELDDAMERQQAESHVLMHGGHVVSVSVHAGAVPSRTVHSAGARAVREELVALRAELRDVLTRLSR